MPILSRTEGKNSDNPSFKENNAEGLLVTEQRNRSPHTIFSLTRRPWFPPPKVLWRRQGGYAW